MKFRYNDKEHGRFFLISDLGLSLAASLFSFLAIRWISDPTPHFTFRLIVWLACAGLATFVGIKATESDKVLRSFFSFKVAIRITNSILIKEVFMIVATLTGVFKFGAPIYPVLAIIIDFLLTVAALIYMRVLVFRLRESSSEQVSRNAFKLSTLIFGTDPEAVQLSETMMSSPDHDFVGFLSDDPAMEGKILNDKVIYLCRNRKELAALMQRLGGIDCILFTKKTDFEQDRNEEGGSEEEAQGPDIQRDGMSPLGHFVKRSFDILLSGVLLIVFSPVILICALAVRLSDGGPALYKQERIGRHGKPFYIYKFRSMRVDAEPGGTPALYSGDNDERLTKVGRFLRVHHLDELPQLWNVFKGDMSFIGYRPERQFYIDKIVQGNPRYRYLYQIRPGVTSYATLYNGYTDTYEKMLTRLDLDLYYLRNHSVEFDLKVLWLTFLNIVVGKRF